MDEARAWIDQTLEGNDDLTPKGIRVSNSFYEDGFRGEYQGIRIVMDPGPDFYPDDTVEIEFE
ncbi:hypothetical protein ASF65_19935 [Aureimonas sp. Leaf324]|nr:hypothetical protein ASF65_19935 [Aureimonas sp. Leaf324]